MPKALSIVPCSSSYICYMVNYQDELIEDLKDHEEAVAYLNAAWEESLKGDEESQQLFLLALRNVIKAQGTL